MLNKTKTIMEMYYKSVHEKLKRKTVFTPDKNHKGRLIYHINQYYMGKLSGEFNRKFCYRDQLADAIQEEHSNGYSTIVHPDWSMLKFNHQM